MVLKSISDAINIIESIKNEQGKKSRKSPDKKSEEVVKIFLPGMEETMRAMPNAIAKGSLFAPIARGKKKAHRETIVYESSSVIVKFWGDQLDEAQADVWMHAMYEAGKVPLGEPVVINRASFLRAIGRSTGKSDYEWLYRAMHGLAFGMISVSVKGKYEIGTHPHSEVMHIIDGFRYAPDTENYIVKIDKRWRLMYSNKEYSLIDWNKRLEITQGKDLAKSLQRLIATSSDKLQRYSLEYLKERAQYQSPMRKFKEALIDAMKELERLDIISGGIIENSTRGNEQAIWTKL
jgi:hypothetical protein